MKNEINGLGKMEVRRAAEHQRSSPHLSQVMLTKRMAVSGLKEYRKRISQEKVCLCQFVKLDA